MIGPQRVNLLQSRDWKKVEVALHSHFSLSLIYHVPHQEASSCWGSGTRGRAVGCT